MTQMSLKHENDTSVIMFVISVHENGINVIIEVKTFMKMVQMLLCL